ncbi:hypothetical protein HDV03_001002, partial [Kappamyces sp. JEL0829]
MRDLAAISLLTLLARGANPNYRAEALGPLEKITDFNGFYADLLRIKGAGVEALATDIWWGQVETANNTFDWSYYDTLSTTIIKAGLKWIPIMSTHQCGGYGQSCNIPVPAWTGLANNQDNYYVDIKGNAIKEAFGPWAGSTPYTLYAGFFNAFAAHYQSVKSSIVRIDLSGGASGEIRYPSYSLSSWQYPARGELFAYSTAAVNDFRAFVMAKYGSIAAVNTAWQSKLTSSSDIRPPCDTTTDSVTTGVCAGLTGSDSFFGATAACVFCQDFGNWYQGSLVKHSAKIADVAHRAFDSVFGVPLTMKIAGIHWQYFNTQQPHAAEKAAGYWNYTSLLVSLKQQGLEATFTALELNDDSGSPNYSGANTLAKQFYQICSAVGVGCGSENALDITATNINAYQNMRSILANSDVKSLTLLRYNDLASSLASLENYATYVSTITPTKASVYFKVTGITVPTGQSLAIVGNNAVLGSGSLGSAFVLSPFCDNTGCTYIGLAKIPNGVGSTVSFSVALLGASSSLVQCEAAYSVSLSAQSNMVIIGSTKSDSTSNGIHYVGVGTPTVTCPGAASSSSASSSSTASSLSITSSTSTSVVTSSAT